MREHHGAFTLTTTPLPTVPTTPISPTPLPRTHQAHTRHRVTANVSECHPQSQSNYGAVRSHTGLDMPTSRPVIRPRNTAMTPKITKCQRSNRNAVSVRRHV